MCTFFPKIPDVVLHVQLLIDLTQNRKIYFRLVLPNISANTMHSLKITQEENIFFKSLIRFFFSAYYIFVEIRMVHFLFYLPLLLIHEFWKIRIFIPISILNLIFYNIFICQLCE